MSDTVTLYRQNRGDLWGEAVKFRTVPWCVTHDAQLDTQQPDEYFVCLQARAWRHHAPKNVCKFVDKLVEA